MNELLEQLKFKDTGGIKSSFSGYPDDKKIKKEGFTIAGNYAIKIDEDHINLIKKNQQTSGDILFSYYQHEGGVYKKFWRKYPYRGVAKVEVEKKKGRIDIQVENAVKSVAVKKDRQYLDTERFGRKGVNEEDIKRSIEQVLYEKLK
jgi:hypothetical protein